VIHKKKLKDLRKVRLKRIFIQEDRDRAIASGLMKNTNLSLVLLKQKKKVKGTQAKKKKRKPFRIFFT
jgi:hypothetical protein